LVRKLGSLFSANGIDPEQNLTRKKSLEARLYNYGMPWLPLRKTDDIYPFPPNFLENIR
jgi:hypothetical protein